MSLAVVRLNFW